MKTLSTAETKLVSVGTGTDGLTIDLLLSAVAVQGRYLPTMRFDASRMAPGDCDDDFYNGLNDRGNGI